MIYKFEVNYKGRYLDEIIIEAETEEEAYNIAVQMVTDDTKIDLIDGR